MSFPTAFSISFFTAVLEVPERPLRWWPPACSLFYCPLPPPLYQMLVLPPTWGSCIGRDGYSHEVLPMDVAKDYLLGEFQRRPLAHAMLGWEMLAGDL